MTIEHASASHRQVIETSLDGYLHIAKSGQVLEVNDAYCRMSGYARDEILGMHISSLGDTAIEVAAHAAQMARAGRYHFETIHRRKDGSFWTADASLAYLEPHGGEMFGFFRDISQQKRTMSDLREQSEFFRLITENLDGFVAVLDLDGVRIYNSPSYERLLGKSETAGTYSFMEVHPQDRARVENAFREVVASGIGQHLEYRFILPDHEGYRHMESRSGVIRDPMGKIKSVAVVSYDITERKRKDAQVHDMAFSDVLTSLPNRRLMLDRLNQVLAASKRSGQYSALFFMDLDNFKPLNDLYGHAVGDLLLIEAASRLKRLMRAEDTVARIGGDEFVVILGALNSSKEESMSIAKNIARKVCNAIAQPYVLPAHTEDGTITEVEHRCTVSIGIALFVDHEVKPDDILHWADLAMYQAKDAGRNAIHFYQPES